MYSNFAQPPNITVTSTVLAVKREALHRKKGTRTVFPFFSRFIDVAKEHLNIFRLCVYDGFIGAPLIEMNAEILRAYTL